MKKYEPTNTKRHEHEVSEYEVTIRHVSAPKIEKSTISANGNLDGISVFSVH